MIVRRHDGFLPLMLAMHSRVLNRSGTAAGAPGTSLTFVHSFLSLFAYVRAMWPDSTALADHDYARLVSAGSSSHISIEMGERRVSGTSDDMI
jgi:hypothetical protein